MRRLFTCHQCSHSQFLKEQMSMAHVNVAAEVFQKFLRQQERCTQHSIDTSNSNKEYGHSPAFHYLIVTKKEGHGLLELDPLRAQTPSSCEHPFPFFESALSGSVSILCQSLLSRCSLRCSDLLRNRRRMMFSPLHRSWVFVFLCLGIHAPNVPSRDRCGNVFVRSGL